MSEPRETPAGEAFIRLILEIFQLHGALLAAGDELTGELGLSSALWQVLGAVDHGPLPMAGIARAMGLTRQSVRRTAYVLEAKGLIEFADNPDHKRAKLVTLTGKGRSILDRVNGLRAEWANSLAEGETIEEMDAATRVLRRFAERLRVTPKA